MAKIYFTVQKSYKCQNRKTSTYCYPIRWGFIWWAM